MHVGYLLGASNTSDSLRTTVLSYPICLPRDDWNFLHGICVGQASNPGPWSLQLRNIVSASKHVEDFSVQADCHVWSETSATTAALNKVLKKSRKLGLSLVSSAPAPTRSKSAGLVGRPNATGALCMSQARATSLASHWEGPLFSSGRIADALLQLSGIQVRVISVYGYHSGIKDSIPKNDVLLGKILHRADSFDVPVIIAGDLNCDINELQSWHSEVARGFVDVAVRQAALWQTEPEPTYKGSSRLDYVLCSRSAATAFQNLLVDPNGYTDHATLVAQFAWESCKQPVPRWLFPRALDSFPRVLQKVSTLQTAEKLADAFHSAISAGDTAAALEAFAKSFEDKADRAYRELYQVPLPANLRGRTKGKLSRTAPVPITPLPQYDSACEGNKVYFFDKVRRWLLELQSLLSRNLDQPKQATLWKRITQCPGFVPSFPEWLLQHDVVLMVPLALPDLAWLDRVIQALDFECNLLNKLQAKERTANIVRMMRLDWSKGGRLHSEAVKAVPLGTLDSLMVVEYRPFRLLRCHKGEPAQIIFEDGKPTPPSVRLTFLTEAGPIEASAAKVLQNKVELNVTAQTAMASMRQVQQSTWSTDTGLIASKIQAFWKGFWQPTVRPDMATVVEMASSLPQLPMFDAYISTDEVAAVIAKLPGGKARGMDGFSMVELKSLGPAEHTMLAELFNKITETGDWPQPMLSSFVSLLAKVPQPKSPKDARPITVLPTLYRLWGKIIGGKIMQAILPHLPGDLFGSVPGRSAADAAWELQALLEQALSDDGEALGVSLDLSKAYNTIPREVVALLADKCGWPPSVKQAYLNFLNSFHRFFKLHGGFHCPTYSDTGVPEGCPIAVPVMIMTTWLVTTWTTKGCDAARFLSYVDNWTLTNATFTGLTASLDRVVQATQALALLLNPDKTRAFATSAEKRKQLGKYTFAGHPLRVCHTHDDLGVWFTSTLRRTSIGLHKRLETNTNKLRKLQTMPWSAQRKSEVLHRTIIPALLHGVSWASTPATFLATLRGKFSAAIWGQHHHRDHFLCPMVSLAQPFEPFLIVFKMRLTDLRRAFARNPAAVSQQWNQVVLGRKSTGALRYFTETCAVASISLEPEMLLAFPDNTPSHAYHSSRAELLQRTTQAWSAYVSVKLSDRPGLDGIQAVDFDFSLRLRRTVKVPAHVPGSFSSNAAVPTKQKLKFLQGKDAVCKHCGESDDATHRLLHCPFYKEARNDFPLEDAASWPKVFLERGLTRKPLSLINWDQLNETRPWPQTQECLDSGVHLFTDGSTDTAKSIPLSSWSVILMEPDSFEHALVFSGVLPGRQSNYRAELFALLVAIYSAPSATIYTDNSSVCLGIRRLQKDGWDPLFWCKQPELQLWREVWQVLSSKNPGAWEFRHVKSHRDFRKQSNEHEAWTAYGNDVADTAAKKANKNRSPRDKLLYSAAIKDWSFQQERFMKLATLQHTVFCTKGSQPDDNQVMQQISAPQGPFSLGEPLPLLSEIPMEDYEDALLGPRFLWVLHKWWSEHKWYAYDGGDLSIAELYFYFSHSTGWMSPQNLAAWDPSSLPFQWRTSVQTAFVTEVDYPTLYFNDVPFAKQCTVFLHALKFFAKRHSLDLRIRRGQALSFLECFDTVPMIGIAPGNLTEVRELFKERVQSSWKSFRQSCYRPSVQPILCPLSVVHPLVTWKCYYSRRKSKATS